MSGESGAGKKQGVHMVAFPVGTQTTKIILDGILQKSDHSSYNSCSEYISAVGVVRPIKM